MSKQSPNGTYWKKRAIKAEAELAKWKTSPPTGIVAGIREYCQHGWPIWMTCSACMSIPTNDHL
jgi:hypothetical protein